MNRISHSTARRFRAALLLAALGMMGNPISAQSQRKSPVKPPPQSTSQPKEDLLAALLQQATEAIDKNDFSAALDPLQKFIAERPGEPYAHLNLGLVLMDSDPGGAAEAFRRAADLQPTESRPRYLAGLSLEHAGTFTEAIDQYRAALVISPKDYECHFALGRALLRTNEASGAEEQFREAIATHGDSAPARLGLANALLAQKKFEAGTDALAEYLKLNPGDRAE